MPLTISADAVSDRHASTKKELSEKRGPALLDGLRFPLGNETRTRSSDVASLVCPAARPTQLRMPQVTGMRIVSVGHALWGLSAAASGKGRTLSETDPHRM